MTVPASKPARISICIPTYRSAEFIEPTLQSVLAQTVSDFEICISNDAGEANSVLETYRDHPKVRVVDQKRRLGWVGNTNAALELARGDYFMVMPHDDRLEPEYLQACLDVLEADPGAFAAVSDLVVDGRLAASQDIRGDALDRARQIMTDLHRGVSYRALMRRDPTQWSALRLRANPPSDFAVDTLWMLQQARFGEIRRVARPLYLKFVRESSARVGWREMPDHDKREAWFAHCRQMRALLLEWLPDEAECQDLYLHRLDPRRVVEAPGYMKVPAADWAAPDRREQAGRPSTVFSNWLRRVQALFSAA